jgi:hypothetical protein
VTKTSRRHVRRVAKRPRWQDGFTVPRAECHIAVQPDRHAGPVDAVRNEPRRSSDRRANRILLAGGINDAKGCLATRGGEPRPRPFIPPCNFKERERPGHEFRTLPEIREAFCKTFVEIAKTNPDALRYIVMLMAFYLDLGPFSKNVILEIDRRIAELDGGSGICQPGWLVAVVYM